jgi:hypothetical protein
VFYWNNQRPDEVGVAVGVLRAEEGSMAREWLEWEVGRCSFVGECVDQEVCGTWVDHNICQSEKVERLLPVFRNTAIFCRP